MKRKLTCTNYFIILEKRDFQESTPNIQMLMFGLAETSNFGLWDIIPPSSISFFFDLILYVHSTIFQLCGTGLPGLNQY